MKTKAPILIWRLKDAPKEVEHTIIEDGFIGDKKGYREWRAGKRGEKFIVMIPASYSFDDMNVALELGLNVAMTDAEEQNSDCEEFSHLHFGRNEEGLQLGYEGYIIPSLTGRTAIPTLGEDE
jgi:hypothetical protein